MYQIVIEMVKAIPSCDRPTTCGREIPHPDYDATKGGGDLGSQSWTHIISTPTRQLKQPTLTFHANSSPTLTRLFSAHMYV